MLLLPSLWPTNFLDFRAGGQISIVQALLEELPGQFLMYMRSRDIKPLDANAAPLAPPDQGHPYPIDKLSEYRISHEA